jgi:hypothetical protein
MSRLKTPVVFALVIFGLSFVGRRPAVQAAPSVSYVCGAISSNTAWTANNSPYQVCPLGATINPGITLTVQSGVTVQFMPGGILNAKGTLLALGAPAQPITFTAVVTQQSPGSWQGISADSTVITPAVVNLDHVTLDFGGTNIPSSGAQLYADHANITVTHSLLRNGAGSGIYATGNGNVSVHDTQFLNNGHKAVHLVQPAAAPDLGGLLASGNNRDVVYVESTTYLHGTQLWPAAGIPYLINAVFGNFEGDSLSIAPGSNLRFTSTGWMNIRGDLTAIGLPGQPITLTGDVATPGYWAGLDLYGLTRPANAELDYVTIEYGGKGISSGANILVDFGNLIARHSLIRHSLKDGVRFSTGGRGSIMNSQITSNAQYGVRNMLTTRFVQATNNWWGDLGGPTSDVAGCSPGHGDKITAGVLFRPVLTDTTTLAAFPLSDAPNLTLTPQRWFAPADGLTKVYFDITLRDGNGAPLPGRTVHLTSSLSGSAVTDGGITDVTGHTLAYMVAFNAGEAEMTAALDVTGCDGTLSPTARVSFTTPVNVTDLFPNSPASYFDGNITVSPMPVLVGVLTTLSAKLTNPLTVPITVDVSFGFAQSGIGLTFGPITDFVGKVIPANSSLTLQTTWVPPVSGKYCIRVTYNITSVGHGLEAPAAGGSSGSKTRNLNVQHGSTGSAAKGNALDRTTNALDAMGSFMGNAFDTDPFSIPLELVNRGIALQLSFSNIIFNALVGDPPRQDFRQLDTPHKLQLPPVQPGGGLSVARAAALNALDDALAQANADARASATALDRSAGASEAGNLQWSSLQTAAVLHYNQLLGTDLITVAARIDNVLNVAAGEGESSLVVSVSQVISVQQHLQAGLTAQEISDAHAVGLTDADLTVIRKQIGDEGPEELAGDQVPKLRALSAQLLALSDVLLHPVVFEPHFSIGGSPGQQVSAAGTPAAPATGNSMVQLFNTTETVQVANPVTATSSITVDLSARRIDLPADWTVSVSPAQVILAPGAQTTVTVEIAAGAPLPQGSLPRVAVEGYVGSRLLGGVVVEVLVPNYVFFDGHLHIYLPLVQR